MELRDLSVFSAVTHLARFRFEDTTLINLGSSPWYLNETNGRCSLESDLSEHLYISCKLTKIVCLANGRMTVFVLLSN
jgi:hypothetical protein